MVKNSKNLAAYTIVELMVVMVIIGVLMGLSIYGMLQFRRITEADQAVKDLVSVIKETKTRAKNNTIDTQNNDPKLLFTNNFGYIIRFVAAQDQVFRSICNKRASEPLWNPLVDCPVLGFQKDVLKQSSFTNITYNTSGTCDAILFENLTERMFLVKSSSLVLLPTTSCEVKVVYKDTGEVFRKITFDSTTGNFVVSI